MINTPIITSRYQHGHAKWTNSPTSGNLVSSELKTVTELISAKINFFASITVSEVGIMADASKIDSNVTSSFGMNDPSRDSDANTEILNATINYVLTTKRFDEWLS